MDERTDLGGVTMTRPYDMKVSFEIDDEGMISAIFHLHEERPDSGASLADYTADECAMMLNWGDPADNTVPEENPTAIYVFGFDSLVAHYEAWLKTNPARTPS